MYEVLIIWSDGERTTHEAINLEVAEGIIDNYKMAFGNQIEYASYTYRMYKKKESSNELGKLLGRKLNCRRF